MHDALQRHLQLSVLGRWYRRCYRADKDDGLKYTYPSGRKDLLCADVPLVFWVSKYVLPTCTKIYLLLVQFQHFREFNR